MKKYVFHGIKFKIIRISTVFTLVITILIASICLGTFQHLLLQSLSQSTKYNLQLIMNTISSDMAPVITLSKWCSSNFQISKYLESTLQNPAPKYYDKNTYYKEVNLAWNRLREEYRNNRSSIYIDRVIISNFNKNYLQFASVTSFKTSVVDTIEAQPYFDSLYHSSTDTWAGLVTDPFSEDSEAQIIPIIGPVYYPYASKEIGWCFISVSSNLLTRSIENYKLPNDSSLYLTIQDKTYHIKNGKYIRIYPSHPILDSGAIQSDKYSVVDVKDENGVKHTMVTVGSSLDGWYLTQSLSEIQFAQQKKVYILLIALTSFIVIGLGFSLTYYLNKLISVPLRKINHKIKLIAQGDFSHDSGIEWDNELGEIGKGINTLSTDIVDLMDTRIESEKEKQELEYQILQSQINPHFLYNTLNSIKWMATIQNATGIAEMTTSLSRLMRAISKDMQQIYTIREEIALLDNYFLIQKYRYGGTISLEYNIECDDLYRCRILKFTLQPMVENAIFHGIEPKGESGFISINIRRHEEDKIRIEIKDNGIGMNEEQIKETLEGNSKNKSEFFKKLGINNVKHRIQYTFGPEYGLTISSEPGRYTIITITIPYIITEPDMKAD